MALKQRIVSTVAGSLAVAVAVTTTVTMVWLYAAFPSWVEHAREVMLAAETDNLRTGVVDKTELAETFFAGIDAQLRIISRHAEALEEGDVPYDAPASYYEMTGVHELPPGYDATTTLSWDVPAWWQCDIEGRFDRDCAGVGAVSELQSQHRNELAKLGAFTPIFKTVARSNMPLGGSFLGFAFESSGMFLSYPWKQSNYQNWQGTCEVTGEQKRGYDPRCRPWYQQAKSARSSVVTAPYKFAADPPVMGVTQSHVLLAPSPNIVGITMSDFVLKQVTDAVVDTVLLESGYGFLMTTEGDTVAHPRFDVNAEESTPSITTAEISRAEDAEDGEEEDFQRVVDTMMNLEIGTVGMETYMRGGSLQHLACQRISGNDYVLCLTVPDDDVQRPFLDTEAAMNAAAGTLAAVMVALLVVVGCGASYVAGVVASGVVSPIQELVRVTRAMNNGDFGNKVGEGGPDGAKANCKELALLYGVFRQLVTVVRMGNSFFFKDSPEEALQVYRQALELFEKLDNPKGQGVASNNIGTTLMSMQNHSEAVGAYEKAVESGERLLAAATSRDQPADEGAAVTVNPGGGDAAEYESSVRLQLTSRLINLAEASKAAGVPVDRCMATVNRAEELTRDSRDPKMVELRVRAVGERAQILAVGGNPTAGIELLDTTAAALAADPAAVASRDKLMQMLALSRARVVAAAPEPDVRRALGILAHLLQSWESLDSAVMASAYSDMQRLCEGAGVPFAGGGPKRVQFVLDCSGSMAGGTIRRAVRNMLMVFDEHCNDEDYVGFVTFNKNAEVQCPLGLKGPHKTTYRETMEGATKLARGRTAFFDAIEMADEMLLDAAPAGGDYIIALTDGADNSSRSANFDSLLARFESRGPSMSTLIIVGLNVEGLAPSLIQLATATPNGQYISARDTSALDQAFARVAELIAGPTLTIETF